MSNANNFLRTLSTFWNELDESAKENISDVIAGKYNSAKFNTYMSNI